MKRQYRSKDFLIEQEEARRKSNKEDNLLIGIVIVITLSCFGLLGWVITLT